VGPCFWKRPKTYHGEWHIKRGEADKKKGVYYNEVAKIPDDLLR
jgi:hypothetical protein